MSRPRVRARRSALTILLLQLAFLLSPPALAVELFGPHLGLRTGTAPSHAAIADFDNNGVLDFATANMTSHDVTVVLGDGQGGFDVQPNVWLGAPYPNGIAAGDFNADGAADLVVSHILFNELSILLGDGEGGFSFGGSAATGGNPTFVGAGDFDFDGTADLAVTNSADDTVTVLSSNGDGSFTTTDVIPVGTFPRAIAIADLDGDGILDLAVANMFSDSISLLTGDGLGGFASAQELMVGGDGEARAPNAIAVHDFDMDGDADLAVTNGAADSVSILLGDGQGGFGAPRDVPAVGDSPVWLAVGDFDDDGDPDLAVANIVGNTLAVLRGEPTVLATGEGGFNVTAEIELQGNPRSVVAGDFTADGATDLAVVLSGSSMVTVLPGDGLGGFGKVQTVADVPLQWQSQLITFRPACVSAADFGGDGHADLAVTSLTENALFVYPGVGDGLFDVAGASRIDVIAPTCPALDDLDGDGDVDIAVASGLQRTGIHAVRILLSDGQGGFSQDQEIPLGTDRWPVWVASADFDLDGNVDLATANYQTDSVSVLLGEGNGSFADPQEIRVGDGPLSLAVADLDSDGSPDLAVANSRSASITLHPGLAGLGGHWMRINSPANIAGDYEMSQAAFGPPLSAEGVSGIVELANDGVGEGTDAFDACDEPLLNSFEGRIALVARGGCAFTEKVKNAQEAGAAAVIVANYPGEPPFVMEGNDPSITIPSVMISLADGFLILGALPDVNVTLLDLDFGRIVPVGVSPASVVAGDFDEDGFVDLAVAHAWDGNVMLGDGTVRILAGDAGGAFSETERITVGEYPDTLLVVDVNLDGLDDLVFALKNDDSVGVLVNAGSRGFVPTPVFRSGRRPTSVTCADFNEDGAPDLAASNLGSDSLSIFLNRIEDRVDPNGSNRVDGFDVVEIGRRTPAVVGEPDYRRTHDVDLNGVIDGDDLALVGKRFGELMKAASPLRIEIPDPPLAAPDTITLQPREQAGDRLTVDVLIDDDNDPSCSAEFAVTFGPAPGDEDPTQVLAAVGFETGDYFTGGVTQPYEVAYEPGEAEVRITRLPTENQVGSGQQRLLSLIFEAKREGAAMLEFAPVEGRAAPSLLDAAGNAVTGVNFVGGVTASVDSTQEDAPGQKIGFSPALLNFGAVPVGSSSKQMLRLANFGFADLEVTGVTSTLAEFTSFFTTGFTVPPYGSVDLPVQFSPTTPGVFAGELIVSSNDPAPERSMVWARVLGRSQLAITVTPSFVDFGTVVVGGSATRRVGIGNRGDAPLLLSGVTVSHEEFVVQSEFTVIEPGGFGTVEIEFHPTSPGPLHGIVTLDFGASAETTVSLTLTGSALAGP